MMRTAAVAVLFCSTVAFAHDGPPYPIVSDLVSAAYRISIWTDPDATDDGTAGGQFWVTIERTAGDEAIPEDTRARVSIRPLDRPGRERTAVAEPVRGDVTNQFAALLMDHEGRFAVLATIDGPLGRVTVDATVDATYDLRPPGYLLLLYVMPFVLVGALWTRLLFRRRAGRGPQRRPGPREGNTAAITQSPDLSDTR